MGRQAIAGFFSLKSAHSLGDTGAARYEYGGWLRRERAKALMVWNK
jgi:hypothetical protein